MGIFTSAENAVLAQYQLGKGDPAHCVDKAKGMYYYPVHVSAMYRTHEHPQIVAIWYRRDVCPASAEVVINIKHLSHVKILQVDSVTASIQPLTQQCA